MADSDRKSALQELLQRSGRPPAEYRLAGETGPDHRKVFLVEVWENGSCLGTGEGRTKKEDFCSHLIDVEVVAVDNLKSKLPESVRNSSRVEGRIVEMNRVLIGAVSNHQRDALVTRRDRRQRNGSRKAEGDRRQNGAARQSGNSREDSEEFSHSSHLPKPPPMASPPMASMNAKCPCE